MENITPSIEPTIGTKTNSSRGKTIGLHITALILAIIAASLIFMSLSWAYSQLKSESPQNNTIEGLNVLPPPIPYTETIKDIAVSKGYNWSSYRNRLLLSNKKEIPFHFIDFSL